MTIFRNVLGWIARTALLFTLILAALFLHSRFSGDVAERLLLDAKSAHEELIAVVYRYGKIPVTTLKSARLVALKDVDNRLREASSQKNELSSGSQKWNDLFSPKDMIKKSVENDLKIAVLDQEIVYLKKLKMRLEPNGNIYTAQSELTKLKDWEKFYDKELRELPKRPLANRYAPPDGLGLPIFLPNYYAEQKKRNFIRQNQVVKKIEAIDVPLVSTQPLLKILQKLLAAISKRNDEVLSSPRERANQAWDAVDNFLPEAMFYVVLAILIPFAIRSLFYWVLAPLASLQKPIQLLETAVPIPLPTERSAVSKAIALAPGTELLVRQGFEQTISLGGAKATQWLLDSRHPLSSLVSGLYFLTRIRGGAGDMITVSATHDPFAEVAVLTLPAGAAAVLQPRAIAGVVQPIATPLRVTSHWRLGTLNAWLTWQLRFLVFHGPAQIILSGGRGVRIEPALAGRSIGQEQLIGFSAGIAYSTGRTETFIPYLFGREPLLKDRIAAGSGVLIAEEAPMARRARRGLGGGLEGAADALLKIFGI